MHFSTKNTHMREVAMLGILSFQGKVFVSFVAFLSCMCACSCANAFALMLHTRCAKYCCDLLKFDLLHVRSPINAFCILHWILIVFSFSCLIPIPCHTHTHSLGSCTLHRFVRVHRRVFGFRNFYCQFRRHFTFIWITCGIPVYSGVNWSRVIHTTHSKLIPPRDGSVTCVSASCMAICAILLHQLHKRNMCASACAWVPLHADLSLMFPHTNRPANQQINEQATKWTATTRHDQQRERWNKAVRCERKNAFGISCKMLFKESNCYLNLINAASSLSFRLFDVWAATRKKLDCSHIDYSIATFIASCYIWYNSNSTKSKRRRTWQFYSACYTTDHPMFLKLFFYERARAHLQHRSCP